MSLTKILADKKMNLNSEKYVVWYCKKIVYVQVLYIFYEIYYDFEIL